MERVSIRRQQPKWQYQQQAQATPRILQLPRSNRPRTNKNHKVLLDNRNSNGKVMMMMMRKANKLELLFDEEREFRRSVGGGFCDRDCEERRDRVNSNVDDGVAMEEEKWRFQAEMLRAECNLLRIEREVAVKKLERRRIQTERILRSALQSLHSGRDKICDGENVMMVMEEEIRSMTEKLEKLQRRRPGVKHLEVKNRTGNFDKQACLLQRKLVKSDETCVKEIREMAEASLSINRGDDHQSFASNENFNMEILRRKMEGLSNGIILNRMEEYGSMLVSTANGSAASSTSTSKRIEMIPDVSSLPKTQPSKEVMCHGEKLCSGHCKAIVRRIVEQVRVETEQWSQMQKMLGQVRDEMEELQTSRDFWEDRALESDHQIQSLQSAVQDWSQKALSSETKANELQAQVTLLRKEIEWLKQEQATAEESRAKASPPMLGANAQNETEKRVLVCRLKENHLVNDSSSKQRMVSGDGRRKANACSSRFVAQKQSPLRDIVNLSPLVRQNNSRAVVYPLHCNVEKKVGREKVCR